jgi:retron-type reverse transcriptase
MSNLVKLKEASNLSDVALLLGYKPKALSYILYKIADEDKYTEFTIPKKSGGERIIKAPVPQLKNLQSRLASLLEECIEETNQKCNFPSISHGFKRKHSIITNAEVHKKRRHVFNIDIKDFFQSINFGRVRGFFIKNKHFELGPNVATVIAQIACHANGLPQGSPCSPIISNIIGHLLDVRMVRLAKRYNCTYSRYVDDLTFSTNKKEFPAEIASKICDDENGWTIGNRLANEIEKVGFLINEKKTSMQFKTRRQVTTGLVVNKKVNIKREYYKNIRAMCHSLFGSGKFMAGDSVGTHNQLEGMLSHVFHIKKNHDERKAGAKRNSPTAIARLYRQFLLYKHSFAIEKPLIICEGKTDIIYLQCALKNLSGEYTSLVSTDGGKYQFGLRFFKMSKNIKDVFGISDGSSGLCALNDMFPEYTKDFKGVGRKHPVIILVDNDDGAKEIKSRLKEKELKKDFYYRGDNLYIIPTPLDSNDKNSMIEDLFDQSTLSEKLEGKKFNPGKMINNKTEYGKAPFAEKIVKKNWKSIKFEGFKVLLNRIERVINHYATELERKAA